MRHTLRYLKNKNSTQKFISRRKQLANHDRIIRIIFIIPVFAVMSFLSVVFNNASIYLKPLETLYESFALSSFFLLLLAFIQEDDEERQAFFETSGTVAAYRVSIRTSEFTTLLIKYRKLLYVSSNSPSSKLFSSSSPKLPKGRGLIAQPPMNSTSLTSGSLSLRL